MTHKRFSNRHAATSDIEQRRRQARGFTLVELLVVVSIIALLVSILLPSLKQAREQAKSIKCLAHSRGMGQSASVFATSHNGYMQISANQGNGKVGYDPADRNSGKYEFSGQELKTWPVAIADASGSPVSDNWKWGVRADTFIAARDKQDKISDEFEMFICPADRVKIATPFYPNGTSIKGTGDPNDPITAGGGTKYWGLLSYAINEDIVGIEAKEKSSGVPWPAVWKNGVWGESNLPNWASAGNRLQGNMDKVYDPGTCLLLADAGANSIQEAESGQFTNSTRTGYANLITSAQAFGPNLANATSRWVQRIPIKRHPRGVVNVTFADNHAATVKPTKFQTDTIEGISVKYPTEFGEQVRVSPYRPYVQQ